MQSVIIATMLAYLLFLSITVVYLTGCAIQESDRSVWWFVGAASAWLSFALRSPVAGVVSLIPPVVR